MRYDHNVISDGVLYRAGEDVPEKGISAGLLTGAEIKPPENPLDKVPEKKPVKAKKERK